MHTHVQLFCVNSNDGFFIKRKKQQQQQQAKSLTEKTKSEYSIFTKQQSSTCYFFDFG